MVKDKKTSESGIEMKIERKREREEEKNWIEPHSDYDYAFYDAIQSNKMSNNRIQLNNAL